MNEKETLVWIKTILPDDKKREIDDVKNVIRDTLVDFHNYVFPKYIKNYKDYLWFVAERMLTIERWQSNINYPLVSATIDAMFGNIFDFGYDFWIKELWLKALCIKSFDFRWQWKKVFKDLIKEVLITWKWYVKDYFIKEEFVDNFFWREIKQDIKVPSMLYLSVFDVMYDRSKWIENSSYKIIRTFSTWNAIKNKVLPLLVEQSWKDKKSVETILNSWLKEYKNQFWHRFSMYDYNPVKSLLATQQWFDVLKTNQTFFELPNANWYNSLIWWYVNTQNWMREDAKNYFLNIDESSYELTEYITDNKRYIFVNGNIVYFWNKVQNIWEVREATYNSIPWTWNSIWAADKQSWLQALQNTLWNASIDNIKLLLWPMFKISGNVPLSKSGKVDFGAFKAFKSNWQQDIEKIQVWVQDFASMNFIQAVDAASQKDFAMTNYIMWWWWAIERTQWWLDLKYNQYKSRLTPITDSVDQLMSNISRSWIFMYLKYFSKKELEKLWLKIEEKFIVDDKWINKFDTIEINSIDIREIIDETNITFSYNSLDKVTKEATRDNITRNLQYLLQYSWWKLNMDEVSKILAWLDFDPLKLFKDQQASESWQAGNEQYQQQQWYQNYWQQSYWQQSYWQQWWYQNYQQQYDKNDDLWQQLQQLYK